MARIDADQPGRGLHLWPMTDPAAGTYFDGAAYTPSARSRGEVMFFAGGVRRIVTWGSRQESVSVTITFATPAVRRLLWEWVDSTPVVLRSLRGEVWAGLLSDLSLPTPAEQPDHLTDGSFSLTTITDDGSV